jgi:hypothetical protein
MQLIAMMKSLSLIAFAAFAFACSMHTAPAQAQRVFVPATGSDGNPALPCRTFQHVHDVTPSGGEIDVLDFTGYGAPIITKAISIRGHGFSGSAGEAGITWRRIMLPVPRVPLQTSTVSGLCSAANLVA